MTLEPPSGTQGFRLWVADTGPGVTDELYRGLTAVRRFRGDEARNRRPDSPGPGIAVTREIADRLGTAARFKASRRRRFRSGTLAAQSLSALRIETKSLFRRRHDYRPCPLVYS